ncbi:MAG: EAL domain-containing protein, partial [Sphaerochaetaceae bacterium]|nr:EAL domain-containing protein [Sphaerochaetaceae bacterium]
MRVVYFDIASLVILFILIISSVSKEQLQSLGMRVFVLSIFNNILATISSLGISILYNTGSTRVGLIYILRSSFIFFQNFNSAIYVTYMVTLSGNYKTEWRRNKLFNNLAGIPLCIIIILLIINNFTPILFKVNINGTITQGHLYYMRYAIWTFYVLLGFFYCMKHKYIFNSKRIFYLVALYPLIIGISVFEYLFQNIVLEAFAITIGNMYIAATILINEEKIDEITGFFTSHSYYETIRKVFINKIPATDLIIDIGNYGLISSVIGPVLKNDVMKKYADTIKKTVAPFKEFPSLYYLGKGQFKIVYYLLDTHKVELLAKELIKACAEPIETQNTHIKFETKICIVQYPDDIDSFERAMVFSDSIGKYLTEDISYGHDIVNTANFNITTDINKIIMRAFANDSFSVFYQPIYNVKEKKFISCEAVLRLKDEDYGYISPELFIPAAEKNGLIGVIGDFVLNEVCSFVSSDDFKKLGLSFVEVNLSVIECMNDTCALRIGNIMKKYNIDPKFINFEVTETALASAFDHF